MTEKLAGDFPEHPLLDISELGEVAIVSDLRAEVPYLSQYIEPYEKVVKIEYVDKNLRSKLPSALESVLRLTRDFSHAPFASLSFPENAEAPELTKFENLFGRDSQIAASFLGDIYPELLETTLVELAKLQGTEFDPQSGEEPGAILHDNQDPESPLGKKFQFYLDWKYPLYGSVDATPLFIANVCNIARSDEGFLFGAVYKNKNSVGQNMAEALYDGAQWLARRLDRNPEGFLEFYKPQFKNLDNQAWMDSFHAYVHADGSFANHKQGIASAEVQGYAYDALMKAAECFRQTFGDFKKAGEFEARARKLRNNFLKEFWVEKEHGGYFALATDRDAVGWPRPLKVRTANMGLLLNSMLLDGTDPEIVRKREITIRSLFDLDMLAAAGIRTMSSDAAAFNPYSYHNGGVWPHVNGLIAAGLERHGFYGLAWELHRRNFKNIEVTHSFPEVLQGGEEITLSGKNVYVYNPQLDMVYLIERVPQEIQAWAVAAVLAAKHKMPLPAGFHRRVPAMPFEATEPNKRQLEQQILSGL